MKELNSPISSEYIPESTLMFRQNQLINDGIIRKKDGICFGVSASWIHLLYKTPRQRHNLFELKGDGFKNFVSRAVEIQERYESLGDIDEALFSEFNVPKVGVKLVKNIADLLEVVRNKIKNENIFFICLNMKVTTESGELVNETHAINIFRYGSSIFFSESNYGVVKFSSYESFEGWLAEKMSDGEEFEFYKKNSKKSIRGNEGQIIQCDLIVDSFMVYHFNLEESSLEEIKEMKNQFNFSKKFDNKINDRIRLFSGSQERTNNQIHFSRSVQEEADYRILSKL